MASEPDAEEQAPYQDNKGYKRTIHDEWFLMKCPKGAFLMRNVKVIFDDATRQWKFMDEAPHSIVIYEDGTLSRDGGKRHGNWCVKNQGDLIVMDIADDNDNLRKKTKYTFCHVTQAHAWLSNRNDWSQSVLVYA